MVEAAAAVPDELGFDAHPIIASLWSALSTSGEAVFYSAADWQRTRLVLWFGNQLLNGDGMIPGAEAWRTFQAGMQALLVSPAEKRRLGIEARPASCDEDEEAAVLMLAKYKADLQ
jgi:hypothetical protein